MEWEQREGNNWGYTTHLKATRFAGGLNYEGKEGEQDKGNDVLV